MDPLRTLARFLTCSGQAACLQCRGHRDQVRGGLCSAYPLPQGLSSHLQLHVCRKVGLPPFCCPVTPIPRHSPAEGLSCPSSTAPEETWGPASSLGSFPVSSHIVVLENCEVCLWLKLLLPSNALLFPPSLSLIRVTSQVSGAACRGLWRLSCLSQFCPLLLCLPAQSSPASLLSGLLPQRPEGLITRSQKARGRPLLPPCVQLCTHCTTPAPSQARGLGRTLVEWRAVDTGLV